MSAGRPNKKMLGIVMLLSAGLLLAGCSGSKSSDTGTYSGSVYTVKRGGYALSYFTHHGNKRKRTCPTQRHFSPLYHRSRPKVETWWGKKQPQFAEIYRQINDENSVSNAAASGSEIFMATCWTTLLVMANEWKSYHALLNGRWRQ